MSAYGPTSLGTSKTVFAGEIPRFTVDEATSDDWEPDDGSFRALIVVLALPRTQGASESFENQKLGKKSGDAPRSCYVRFGESNPCFPRT